MSRNLFRSRKPPAPLPLTRMSVASSSVSLSSKAEVVGNRVNENVTVTVRFRPLSQREIRKGDDIAWYADGDYTVRNESNPSISFGYDKVFGPATATHHVYDVAAQHVVTGSMEGINGTVFAYGVTSSGKTYTMHGEQKSPGIIPLAVQDVFDIIQETPEREFLLRVSYMEIYNEVINDLLDPTGQNLKIREDAQGTYVVGIKEEVVLSPAHTLSLIASGEEHRHVGSNNFNLLSSRSHTIFTLTIESSPCGENQGEDVRLSQLNLIDLAGSESSKTETTGLRRKEGSYINKSLLTLGTVISKLTDGKSTHIPYRDSKLTRLLQSSLSGYGRISLICTLTPASSNREETHNTLIFAHRSKHVQIKASQNKIVDDKSLIKKYQKEISCLKQELQQLKSGMMENPYKMETNHEDVVNLKLQLEAGQVQLQSRLEEEEQAKAALLGRIQRLTKLILVSTKNTIPSPVPKNPGYRRSYSICEDELAYFPRRRTHVIDESARSYGSEISSNEMSDAADLEELVKDYKMNTRQGKMGWFKFRKPEHSVGSSISSDSESSTSGSQNTKIGERRVTFTETKGGTWKPVGMLGDDTSILESFPGKNEAGDLFSTSVGRRLLIPSASTVVDQMDLLHEQVKLLAGETALCNSSLKRLSEAAANKPFDLQLQEKILKLKNEKKEKKVQMQVIEQRIVGSVEATHHTSTTIEMSQALSKLATQLNEKTFELEIKSADNRILQEQLQLKVSENTELQQTILLLRRQLDSFVLAKSSNYPSQPIDNGVATHKTSCESSVKARYDDQDEFRVHGEICCNESTPTSVMNSNIILFQEELNESGTGVRPDNSFEKPQYTVALDENIRFERDAVLETASHQRENTEDQLRKSIGGSKSEGDMENELADLWTPGSKLKKPATSLEETSSAGHHNSKNEYLIARNRFWSSDGNYRTTRPEGKTFRNMDRENTLEKLKANYVKEISRSKESFELRLKDDGMSGLGNASFKEPQNPQRFAT